MANPIDTTFLQGFDADKFRNAIKNTMEMGSPNKTQDKATFQWAVQKRYTREDSGHAPFDFASTPLTTDAKADVQVDVAVEFTPQTLIEGTGVGDFNVGRAILTLLDVDYEQVATADFVLLGDNKYVIEYTAPPTGLGPVDVYQMYARSVDEV